MFLQIIKQQDVGLRKINITKETKPKLMGAQATSVIKVNVSASSTEEELSTAI